MNENFLTSIAVLLEIGMPAIFLVLYFKKGKSQNLSIVLLGSSFIWLLLYFFITVSHFLGFSKDSFAFYAVWIMSLTPYLLTLIVGLGLFFVSGRFKKKLQKFFIGLISFFIVVGSIYAFQ